MLVKSVSLLYEVRNCGVYCECQGYFMHDLSFGLRRRIRGKNCGNGTSINERKDSSAESWVGMYTAWLSVNTYCKLETHEKWKI